MKKENSWKERFKKLTNGVKRVWSPDIFKVKENDSKTKQIMKISALCAYRVSIGMVGAVIAPGPTAVVALGSLGYHYIKRDVLACKVNSTINASVKNINTEMSNGHSEVKTRKQFNLNDYDNLRGVGNNTNSYGNSSRGQSNSKSSDDMTDYISKMLREIPR